jgi:hypothetical protein
MFNVLFYLLFELLISCRYCLDVLLFEKIQNYEEKTLSSNKQEERQVALNHIDSYAHIWTILILMLTYWPASFNIII